MIKICGLHQPDDLALAKSLGADVLGMIHGVPESPRNNSSIELKHLFEKAENSQTALLFRNSDLETVNSTLNHHSPTIVHFCGNETPEFRSEIKHNFPLIQIWQSYGVDVTKEFSQTDKDVILALLNESNVTQVVLDAKKLGKTGGTGELLPLESIKSNLQSELPNLMIAGGLNPENVVQVIEQLNPKGVDVSSGIEATPGRKDDKKLKRFISLSKQALN